MELASSAALQRPIKASVDRAIDLVHLSRMTFGDRALEREVLQLFARQSAQIVAKLATASAAEMSPLAHTLKGSAAGVGAWSVADAAGAVERASQSPDQIDRTVGRLREAVAEACSLVEDLLGSH